MEEKEYHKMFDVEGRHWWYAGLRTAVISELKTRLERKDTFVLDAGCGTGGVLKEIQGRCVSIGVDLSHVALALCKKRGLERLVNGSVACLPLKDNAFDAVISLDVIYHRGVEDDILALREFRRVLKDDGLLVLNLPAYEFLRSTHDEHVHASRRYTKKEITKKLNDAGFKIERVTYRNAVLFPVVFAVRLFKSGTRQGKSDVEKVAGPLNFMLTKVLFFETWFLKYFDLPFGSSIFCVARK
ncbi:MAG: class I SAM-dependent methyltransferase [Deltaproteobacteria bacterium]|nr:class I SAM-dependent methyltransferase [Deltaproteobacteria bacterium]